MGQLLDSHFPMPGLSAAGGTRGPGRPPVNLSGAVLLTLHMPCQLSDGRFMDMLTYGMHTQSKRNVIG